jgi:hypothetical protein
MRLPLALSANIRRTAFTASAALILGTGGAIVLAASPAQAQTACSADISQAITDNNAAIAADNSDDTAAALADNDATGPAITASETACADLNSQQQLYLLEAQLANTQAAAWNLTGLVSLAQAQQLLVQSDLQSALAL